METNKKTRKKTSFLLFQALTFAPNTAMPSSKSSFNAAMAAATADFITAFFLHHNVDGTTTTPQHTTINRYFEIESTYLSGHTVEQIC
eukprot:12890056-Ditylum_brightwellii.AAC.1